MQQSEVKPQAAVEAAVLAAAAQPARVDTATILNWTLRVACSMCFIGHGAWGVITKAGWLPFYEVFGVPEWLAWHTMPLIGTMDITLGLMVLFHPCRAVLAYMTFWAVFTAVLRPLAGMGWWEVLERAGNYGPPFAFYMIARAQGLGWLDRVLPSALSHDVLNRIRWTLQISIALLMIGHGGFGAFQAKEVLIDHWSSLGLAVDADFVRIVGAGEMLAGVLVLFVTTPAYLVLLAVYKAATELLYPIAGTVVDAWEWVERGGDYAGPMALICALAMLKGSGGAERIRARSKPPGARRALRTAAACFAFTACLVVAYISSSVSFQVRDVHFEEYGKLIEYGYHKSGWLPANLPPSSRNIHERHEISTRRVVAAFEIGDASELERFIDRIRKSAESPGALCHPPPALVQDAGFWPQDLYQTRALDIFSSRDGAVFAIDRAAAQIYYWTCT